MELKVEARINGSFEGWSGDTLFELTNGQIWKQAKYKYKYTYKYRPEARIFKDGSKYFLNVEGVDEVLEVIKIH